MAYESPDDIREIPIKIRVSNQEYRRLVAAMRRRRESLAAVVRALALEAAAADEANVETQRAA
mgnify:FL=1